MIGDADILARQHHVARRAGPDIDRAALAGWPLAGLDETQRAGDRPSPPQGPAPGERLAGGQPGRLLCRWQPHAAVALRRAVRGAQHDLGDLLAGGEAAIDQPCRAQLLERGEIVGHMFRLAQHRRLPIEAKPGEILVDRRLELRPAAGEVDVLDPQHETPPSRRAVSNCGQRREGVALVQVSGGRWREPRGAHRARPGLR